MYLEGEDSLKPYAKQAASFICHVLPKNPWNKVAYTPGDENMHDSESNTHKQEKKLCQLTVRIALVGQSICVQEGCYTSEWGPTHNT